MATASGMRTLDAMASGSARAQRRMLEGLDKRERALFMDMLARLVRINNDVSRAPVNAPA